MSTTVDDIVEGIVSRRIDQHAALRRFQELSRTERDLLLSRLKSRLAGDASKDATAAAPVLKSVNERSMSEAQRAFIAGLAARYARFAPKSRENASKHRRYLVDARKCAHVRKSIKALQFHITYERAEGPYLYDIDGNRYIDITGDNGVNLFGSRPDFIREAIADRLDRGYPLVGYTEDLFAAARLLCEITGNERVAFTQSGTEAVMWAVRIARAATQKTKIVIFEGAYHGMSDTVAAARNSEGDSVPSGFGIPQEYADQLIVLNYGDLDQLGIIEARSGEIAGVLVEPIQASRPQLQPVEYLRALRKLTLEKGIPLIFDEMITGFRVCPKGVQGAFEIKADITTYGKIPGGGMPTGMIAGSARYMDLVDGGSWGYEDDSMPGLMRIYLGGTHTRNPLKLAAARAVLAEIRKRCPGDLSCESCDCFQKALNARTQAMAEKLNAFFLQARVPIVVDHFSSLFKFRFTDNSRGFTKELFLVLLRMNGVETSVSGNFFLTSAHGDEHVGEIVDAVRESIRTLIDEGFFHEAGQGRGTTAIAMQAATRTAKTTDEDRAAAASAADAHAFEEFRRLVESIH